MKFAYADPPYIGCANRYEEKTEVNHADLIAYLTYTFDGWALSCHVPSLDYLLSIAPEGTRVCAWVKPFAVFKPNVNPAYTWEPVLLYGARKRSRALATVKDHLVANITLRKGLVGAKPPQFCHWILDLLGVEVGDHFADLYPGTGIMEKCWQERFLSTEQMDLILTG